MQLVSPTTSPISSAPTGGEPIIRVDNLVKRYKKADENAVDGISFDVHPGEFFTLLGPNGAGKTTTISILTTTLIPTGGTVHIAGFDIVKQAAQVRQQVGIIFQNQSLDQNLTAEENIRFHAVLYGLVPFRPSYSLMPREYKQRINELAEVIGLGKELFKPVKSYSGGMKRKLEIIRSLIHRPRVLFLDEPTTGLDPLSRHNLWEYLREVRQGRGTTTFLTTHYLEEAEEADTVCILNKGKVVSFGTPEQVKSELLQEYVVIDAEDRLALRAELLRLGLLTTETAPFRVELGNRTVHQVLKSIDTPLTVVQVHTPTLEDAYLEVISRA
jgi:ABC-2 type transport system ATP-binding protein